jgi:hypothetical protein
MRRHPLVAVLVVGVLFLSTTGPAVAASEEHEAEAEGTGLKIWLGGDDGGGLVAGHTLAEVTSGPSARGEGVGFSALDGSFSSASVDAEGSDSDSGKCAGEDNPLAGLLRIDSCSSAEASIEDGLPSAWAEATGLEVELRTALLAEALAELAVGLEPVQEGLDEATEAVLLPVADGLADACQQVLDPTYEGLHAALEEFPDEFDPLIEALEAVVVDDLPESCQLLHDILTDPPTITGLLGGLAAALADLTLLDLELAATESESAASEGGTAALAQATGLDLTLPSLAAVVAVLEAVLEPLLGPFIDEVEQRYDAVVERTPEELAAMVGAFLALLEDDSPILALTAGRSWAWAGYHRDERDFDGEGGIGVVSARISDTLGTLLGESSFELEEEGDEAILFEDTPLQSRIAIGFVSTEPDERDGLPGIRTTAEGLHLTLVEVPDDEDQGPVLELAVSETTAATYAGVRPSGDDPILPVTGGSSSPLAVLMIAAAMVLTRRWFTGSGG